MGRRSHTQAGFQLRKDGPYLDRESASSTIDRRAEIEIYGLPNSAHYTPRSYLAAKMSINPKTLHYQRVTSRFFVLSAARKGKNLLHAMQFFSINRGTDPLRLPRVSAVRKTCMGRDHHPRQLLSAPTSEPLVNKNQPGQSEALRLAR